MIWKFSPKNIYNADETGVSIVPTKIWKAFSPRGNKGVTNAVSTERGENTTFFCFR